MDARYLHVRLLIWDPALESEYWIEIHLQSASEVVQEIEKRGCTIRNVHYSISERP